MADYWWTGDTDGDFEKTTNWKDEDGTAAADYPGNSQADNIWFTARAASNLDTNTDQSANANGIMDVHVLDGFAKKIGSSTAPLILKSATTPEWDFCGDDFDEIWMVSASGTVTLVTITKGNGDADDFHLAFVTNACTEMNVVGGEVTLDKLILTSTSAGVATLEVAGGNFDSSPEVILECPVTTSITQRDGTVYWKQGTITQLYGKGGTFSCERSRIARTLTNATLEKGHYADFWTGDPSAITFSNALNVDGGTLRLDIGATATISHS